MNLDKALSRAGKVTTRKQAAELYNSIEYELALGENTPAQDQEGEAAIRQLEQRFPGIQAEARDVEKPPELSRPAARRAQPGGHSEPSRRRQRGEHDREGTRPSTKRAPASSSAPARARSGSSRGRSRGSSTVGGLTGKFDATDMALGGLRLILLLGLGYFILTARGSNAFSTILGGLGTGVRLIVSPIDPLGGTGQLVKASTVKSAGGAAGQAASGPAAAATTAGAAAAKAAAGVARNATGPRGSHVRQSTGPGGGGTIRLPQPLLQGF